MNKFGKYLVKGMESVGTVNRTIGKGVSKGTDFVADKVVAPAAKSMVKDTTPGIANLWTGKRESGVGIAAAFGVAAIYGGYSGMKQTTLAPKTGEVSYGGTAPVMNADGVSTTPQAPLSGAPTLGANGQMVFGLHNARKG